MRVTYRPRPSLKALARQYHDYGRWRREVARRHPETVSLRYLAAPAAVTGVAAGVALAGVGLATRRPWLTALGLSAPIGYAALDIAASIQSALGSPRLGPRGGGHAAGGVRDDARGVGTGFPARPRSGLTGCWHAFAGRGPPGSR